jgi:hypothetical protein
MAIDVASLSAQLGKSILASLKTDSAKVKALAVNEGNQLAQALSQIAELLAQGIIDTDEAAIMVQEQKDASEAVLSMLAEISRVAARKSVVKALKGVITIVETAAGVPFLGPLLNIVTARS